MPGIINGSQQYASKGRNGDTMMAHLTPGEVVMPKEVAALRPDLVAHIANQIKLMGGNPKNIVAGYGRVNPETGIEEFATEQEVRDAYKQYLGTDPDAAGLAHQLNAFNSGAFSTAQILDNIKNSPDAAKYSAAQSAAPATAASTGGGGGGGAPSVDVNNWYRGVLGRDADQPGLAAWNSQLAKGMSATDAFNWFKTSAAQNGESVNGSFGMNDTYAGSGRTRAGGDGGTLTDEWAMNNKVNMSPEAAARLKADYAVAAGQGGTASKALYDRFLKENNVANGMDYGTASRFGMDADRKPQPPSFSQASSMPTLGNPTPWNVTPEQTVESRIQGIINGTLGQQARGRAMGTMNERGLTNSSIAIGAADDAAYNAAIPIATTDAGTFAKAAGYNADQSNQFATKNADIATQFGLAEMGDRNRLDITRINDATTRSGQSNQMEVAKLNAATNVSISTMDNVQKSTALQLQLDNKTLLETNQQSAQAFNTGMQAVNTINMNDKMDANTKTQAVAQVWRDVSLQLTVLGGVSGLEMKTRNALKNYPGFNENGVYVGFDAEGNTLGKTLPEDTTKPAATAPGIVTAPQLPPQQTGGL